MRRFYYQIALLIFALPLLGTPQAYAADFQKGLEHFLSPFKSMGRSIKRLRDDDARVCDDKKIVETIRRQFAHQSRRQLLQPRLKIRSLSGIHQHRYIETSEEQLIARRYCGATALMTDGRQREVWYIVENAMGLASIDDGVQSCVSGFDDWYVHNAACRIER